MESTPGLGDWADPSSSWPVRQQARRQRRRRRRRGRLRAGRLRRELAALEAALTAQTPGLASLYQTFNELHWDGRPPAAAPHGGEPPRPRFWRRPRFAGVATLAVLAMVVALCATLSVELRPASPSCLSAGSSASVSAATAAQLRALDCGEYPANK